MLLEKLMNIDIEKNKKIKKEDVLSILSVLEKDSMFTFETLRAANFDKVIINKFFEYAKEDELVLVNYFYDCEIQNDTEVTENIDSECVFCRNKISDKGHVITEEYILIDKVFDEFQQIKKAEFDEYIPIEYQLNYKRLKQNLQNTIPFLGSGISIPLGIPSWTGLIKLMEEGLFNENREAFNKYLENGDLFKAMNFLMSESMTYGQDDDIKKCICEFIDENLKEDLPSKYHNIYDLLSLKSSFYLTTNYDTALSKYRDRFLTPFIFSEIENTQEILNKNNQRIIHLHGYTDKSSSMIVTENNYKAMYNQSKSKNENILSGIMSNKSLLFIGFSFSDQYFKELYEVLHDNLGGEHYIVVADLNRFEAQEMMQVGLKPISINVKSYKKEIDFSNEINNNYTQRFVNSLKFFINNLIS